MTPGHGGSDIPAAQPGPGAPSPTLRGDRRYLSVVLGVPAPVREGILGWRAAQGLGATAPPHVTVFIAETDPAEPLPADTAAVLGRACRGVGPFDVLLHGTGTFLPVSPVAYLRITEGAAQLARLHEACARVLPDASPFDYHPHLTLAHGLPEDGLRRAQEDFGGYRQRFRARRLEVFHGDRAGWRDLGTLPL